MTDTNNEAVQENVIKTITSMDQINQIIKRKDVTYASHYMVPSLKREVPFNEINTSQQKRLVKSVIDSPVYNTEFIYTLREILKENCQDSTVNVDELTIIDKLVLALALRIRSIGNTVDIEVQTKEKKNVTVSLDVSKVHEIALATLQDISNKTLEDPYYKVVCSVPTIGVEYKLEKELRNKVTSIQIENVQELRQTIGDAFIGELVKYVSAVYIKSTDDVLIPVDWAQFSYVNRIKVVETFKTGLLKDIMEYINSVRKEVDKIELINIEFEDEKMERRLSIDGNFFTIS